MTADPDAESPKSRRRTLLTGLIGVVLAAGAAAAGYFAGGPAARPALPPDRPRALADFSLTERSGRTVRGAELRGNYCVVSFVFTGCGLTCIAVSRQMAEVQELVRGQPDVRLASITVDPSTDTPGVLARFADDFGAAPDSWLFLTGDETAVYPLLETSFLPKDTSGGAAGRMPGGFLRTEQIALVDPRGRVRAYFDGTKPGAAKAVAEEIRRLRGQTGGG